MRGLLFEHQYCDRYPILESQELSKNAMFSNKTEGNRRRALLKPIQQNIEITYKRKGFQFTVFQFFTFRYFSVETFKMRIQRLEQG